MNAMHIRALLQGMQQQLACGSRPNLAGRACTTMRRIFSKCSQASCELKFAGTHWPCRSSDVLASSVNVVAGMSHVSFHLELH